MSNTATTIFVSALTIAFCFLFRPSHGRCPDGWWVPEGVRRSGQFVCRPEPVGDTVRVGRAIIDRSVQPAGAIVVRVYCEPNAIPTIVDTSSVSCRVF